MPAPDPSLVVLAAGLGTRFGGPKQLAPVGPNGEAILDYSASVAHQAGFVNVVLVVRSEIAHDVQAHVRRHWPSAVDVSFVWQDRDERAVRAARRGRVKPLGTAHAVACAARHVAGPFAVVNADDLYGGRAFALLAGALRDKPEDGALVPYEVARTLIGDAPVKRALCELEGGWLRSVAEGTVSSPDGEGRRTWTGLSGAPIVALTGHEPVSMNIWGFPHAAMAAMGDASDAFVSAKAEDDAQEVLLPDVVRDLMTAAAPVAFAALPVDDSCLGITHPSDLDVLRSMCDVPAW